MQIISYYLENDNEEKVCTHLIISNVIFKGTFHMWLTRSLHTEPIDLAGWKVLAAPTAIGFA